MAFDLSQFLAKGIVYGGQRASKFDVQATVPPAIIGAIDPSFGQKLQYTCTGASFPAFNLGLVRIPYFGRFIKSSGDRDWDDWRITVMADEDWNTRSAFEAWNNSINALVSNYMLSAEDNSSPSTTLTSFTEENYKSNWLITGYAKNTTANRQYTLIGAWPRIVGEMNVSWEDQNRILSFPVTVSFDTMVPSIEGYAGNQSVYSQNT